MENIKVNKARLVEIVTKNRDAHRAVFEKALLKWQDLVVKELEQQVERARKGVVITTYTSFQRPVDHTKDYDRVLLMLKMSVDDVVELDEATFSWYVQDDWDWKQQWTTSNAQYGV